MNELGLLIQSRNKVVSNWCQDSLARDIHELRINPSHPLARYWSVVGAIYATELTKVSWEFIERDVPFLALSALSKNVEKRYAVTSRYPSALLGSWNDQSNHEEIISVLNETIEGITTCSNLYSQS
ncbi:MAG: hypothetical protein ACW99G_18230 [Candidatus Thorarchaeota archaeon]|jgi:hypothetical protein